MRKIFLIALLLACASAASAQSTYRFSSQVTQSRIVAGIANVLVSAPTSIVSICNAPANAVPCTNRATTYTDATGTVACSTATQLVLDGTTSCVANPDANGNWGVWLVGGQYAYTVSVNGANYGPYYLSVTIGGAVPLNVIPVNGTTYPCTGTALQSAMATAITLGVSTVDARGCGNLTLTSELDVGNSSYVPIDLLVPDYGTWTINFSNPAKCGIKVFSKGTITGNAPAGTGAFTLTPAVGASILSALCTDQAPGPGASYVNISGVSANNPNNATLAGPLIDINHLFDESTVDRVMAYSYSNAIGIRFNDFCCGSIFKNILSDGGGNVGAIPVVIGGGTVTGPTTYGGAFYGLTAAHQGFGQNALQLNYNSGAATINSVQIHNLMLEWETGADNTTPYVSLVGALSANFDGVSVVPGPSGTNYVFSIANTGTVKNIQIKDVVQSSGTAYTVTNAITSTNVSSNWLATYQYMGATGGECYTGFGLAGTSCPAGGGSGAVNSGTANQLAYYAGSGTTVSGTNAIPNATTATTQSTGDTSTKVATDQFVSNDAILQSLMTTLGDTLYENASPAPARLAGPTSQNIPYALCDTPSGGAAQAPAWCLGGTPVDAQTGTSYTIANTDRSTLVTLSNASPVAISLPQAGAGNFTNNFTHAEFNIGAGLATITPTTSTINGNATQIVPNHWGSFIYSDNSNYRSLTVPDISVFPSCSATTGALSFTTATGVFGCNTSNVASTFTTNGTTAGFTDYPQGTTSAAVGPCNTATSICEQAPTAVTSYLVNKPGTAATGLVTNNVASAIDTQGFSGDSNHSATVTTGSGSSIGSTSLCSSTFCTAGTYVVHVYIDITTACGTSGTYIVNLIYTDDQGSKTIPVNINGSGAVPATGVLTTTSTANFGESAQVIRLTSGGINYSTTATACGSAGPMVGKLYLAAVPVM